MFHIYNISRLFISGLEVDFNVNIFSIFFHSFLQENRHPDFICGIMKYFSCMIVIEKCIIMV